MKLIKLFRMYLFSEQEKQYNYYLTLDKQLSKVATFFKQGFVDLTSCDNMELLIKGRFGFIWVYAGQKVVVKIVFKDFKPAEIVTQQKILVEGLGTCLLSVNYDTHAYLTLSTI